VKLINLDDFVILGAGSEWLWTMVSGVVLAVTFIAIYRQLSLQRDAAAIDQVRAITREWTDERMARAKLEVVTLISDGASPETTLTAALDIGDFWEDFAFLVRSGNLDRKLIYNSVGPSVRIYWELLKPSARAARERARDDGIWVDFEWLAGVFAEFDRKAGERATFNSAYLAEQLPHLMQSNRIAIRRFEDLRAVIVHPSPPAEVEPGPGRPSRARKRPAIQGA